MSKKSMVKLKLLLTELTVLTMSSDSPLLNNTVPCNSRLGVCMTSTRMAACRSTWRQESDTCVCRILEKIWNARQKQPGV